MTLGGPVIGASASDVNWSNTGPYVDSIRYSFITNMDQIALALQSNDLDMSGSIFDSAYFGFLNADPNIDLSTRLRNGYGHITINCREYPLNISAFRRAFAYAFDKTQVTNDIFNGFSIEHDSLVPEVNPWCIEDQLTSHYYTAQVELGNEILDNAGFAIDTETGFRNAPDGSPFDIRLDYAQISQDIAGGVAQIGVDALQLLHVNAQAVPSDFNDYISRIDSHGDYDMVFYAVNFNQVDIDWLAYDYWSEYADVPYQNPTNFVNASYDAWREQLLYGTSYEEIYEAAAEMQKILHYNVPRLVTYENTYIDAYRNDRFEGQVNDAMAGIPGWWTNQKVHLKESIGGPFGGTFRATIPYQPTSLNVLCSTSTNDWTILGELYDTLLKAAPDGTDLPWLAKSYSIETHTDNSLVPAGHTRITFNMIENATWSDGMQISARDVAFTINYMRDHALGEFGQLYAAYAPTDYQFVAEFIGESYWYLHDVAYTYIVPKHIWMNIDNPRSYNPTWTELVTSGPFYISDYIDGEMIELSKNPYFFYLPGGFDADSLALPAPTTCSYTPITRSENDETPPTIDGEGVTPLGPILTSMYSSNWDTTPVGFSDGDKLVGDHVVVSTSWSNLPASLDHVEMEILSGTFIERSGTIAEPYADVWPIDLTMTGHYMVEVIENIHVGETVRCLLHMEPFSNDPSLGIYEWRDGEFGQLLLSLDSGGGAFDEEGAFVAPYDMTIAAVIYAWSYAYVPGSYYLTIDTRASVLCDSNSMDVSYDTYYFSPDAPAYFAIGANFTVDIIARAFVTLEDESQIVYTDTIESVEICNFFTPEVNVISPNGGEVWNDAGLVTWTSSDSNMYEELVHEIYASIDAGQTFQLIAKDITQEQFSWDCSEWQILDSYMIMVKTTDGALWGLDKSDDSFTAGGIAVDDTRSPNIRGTDTKLIFEGSVGNFIIWSAFDIYPGTIEVWMNDGLLFSQSWTSNDVVVNCDSQTAGFYKYMLRAIDENGNSETMTTWLIVQLSTPYQEVWSAIAAYEEYYDDDYNDWICGITIHAKTDMNMVQTMAFEFEGLARGAGYHHAQHLRIPADTFLSAGSYVVYTYNQYGKLISTSEPGIFSSGEEIDVTVFPDSWIALPPHDPAYVDARMANVYDGSGIQAGQRAVVSIVFDAAFYMDMNQYSLPNIGVHGEGLFFDPWMEVPSAGISVHTGDDWELIVPSDWRWPQELAPIWDVYHSVLPGLPISFPDQWYLSQPTDLIWQPYGPVGKIVFDYSHGQYRGEVAQLDTSLGNDLAQLGYEVVWARGGLNQTILDNAVGLVIGSINGIPFSTSEISTISYWFNQGNKFLWVGCDSDFEDELIYENMIEVLNTVGSHVYPEPTSIEDPVSNCGTSYRVVATEVGTDGLVQDFVSDTDHVLMHGPTCLYGSMSGQSADDAFALESTGLPTVYSLLHYGPNAQIVDSNPNLMPYAHSVNEVGSFVAATLEINAGLSQTSVIVVSGASPYGDWMPMYASEYYGVPLNGYNLVRQTISNGIELASIFEPIHIGNDITWETFGSPETLDPHRDYERLGNWISDNVYETLFTYPFDSSDNSELVPLLAESVEISPDGLNYTFHLRENILFHDGTPFDAQAVKYNIERILKIFDLVGPAWMIAEPILGSQDIEDAVYNYGAGSPEHIDAYQNWLSQKPVIVLDTYTVRIRLHAPFAPFLQCLAYKVASMISPTWIETHGGVQFGENNEYVDTHTCGTGPYEVLYWIQEDSLKLTKNTDYWRSPENLDYYPFAGTIDGITINTNYDSNSRILNLISETTDAADIPIQDSNMVWDSQSKTSIYDNINVYTTGLTYNVIHLGFNMHEFIVTDDVRENPFALIDLRRALSYGFQYQQLIDNVVNGLAVQAQGPIPIGMFSHDDSLFMFESNLNLAVESWNLAMQNGLNDILDNNSYSLKFYYNIGNAIREQICLTLRDCLQDILEQPGTIQPSSPLQIDIIPLEWTSYLEMVRNAQLPVFFLGWAADYADPQNYVSSFCYSYGTIPNRIGYSNPTLDEWIQQAQMTLDDNLRIQLYSFIQEQIVNDVPYIWLYQQTDFQVENAKLHGYSFNPMRGPYFYHMWKEQVPPIHFDPQTTISWETSHNPSTLDPHICYEAIGNWISYNVYETLFAYPRDSPSTDTLVPLLAESVDVSENGLEYTFHLRHGITFQDGTPFNAEAVKYNIERAIAIFDPTGPAWMLAEPLLNCRAIQDAVFDEGPGGGQGGPNHEALFNAWKAENDAGTGALWVIDDYTIMMRLAYSYAPFLHALTYEVGAMISPTWIENHGGVVIGQSNPYVDTHACGTGPYQLVSWIPDNQILLVQNHNYWGKDEAQTINVNSGSIETVVIQINPDDNSREDNLLQGETDGCLWPLADAYEIWDPETQTSLNPQIQVWSTELSYVLRGVGFNLRQYIEIDGLTIENPFYLKDLRIALSYAFDYDFLIESTFSSLAVQGQGPIPIGLFGHDDNLFMYTYDIDLAVQAWNAAMASGLDQILANDGYSLKLYSVNSWWMSPMLDYVEQALRAILAHEDAIQPSQTLNIEVVFLDSASYIGLRNAGNLPIIPVGWAPDYADPDDYAVGFTSSYAAWGRFIGYGNEITDAWIQQAAGSMDEAERFSLYQQIQQAVVDEVAYIWVAQEKNFHVERWNVHGYSFNPMKSGSYFYDYWKESADYYMPPEFLEFKEYDFNYALDNGLVDMASGTRFNFYPDSVNYNRYDIWRRYHGFTINCAKYPLNETAFRQAIAYALDKQRIIEEGWMGAGIPIDSVVPYTLFYSAESEFNYNYYDAQVEYANSLLDLAGFIDVDLDGYRESPNGDPLHIIVESPLDFSQGQATSELLCYALDQLHISSEIDEVPYNEYMERLNTHSDYDIAYTASSNFIGDYELEWLADWFASENINTYGMNSANFENATVDALLDLLFSTPDYSAVLETASEIQQILHYECPMIPVVAYTHSTAVRWNIHNVQMSYMEGATNFDTYLSMLTSSPYLNTITTAVENPPLSTNPFIADWWTFQYGDFNPMTLVYEGLARFDTSGATIPCIAESWSISEGVGTSIVDVNLRNVLWQDLSPMTAADVEFTYNYMITYRAPLFSDTLALLTDIEIVDSTHLRLHLSTTSYLDICKILRVPILPQHIWETVLDPYTFDNPNPIGTGPFMFVSQSWDTIWAQTSDDFAGNQMVSVDWPEDAVVWTEEAGDYLIGVDYYSGELPLDYTITISYDGHSEVITGTFTSEDVLSLDYVPSTASEIEGIHYVTLPANTEVTIVVDWTTPGGYADLDIYMWSPSSEYSPHLESLLLQRWHDYYNSPFEPKLLDSYVDISPSWASTTEFSVYWRADGPYEVTDATVYWAYSSDNIAWTSWELLGEFTPLSTYGAGYIDFTAVYGEGYYAFRIEANDIIGHFSSYEFYTGLDLHGPIADAGQDWIIQQWDYFTFDGFGSSDNIEIASYEWTFYDEGNVHLWGPNPTYRFTHEGVFEVMLTVTDNTGFTSIDFMSITVVYDVMPPQTTVTGPPSGSTVSEDTTYIAESEDDTGVDHTEVYLDGNLVLSVQSSVVDYVLDPSTIADGEHTIEFKVYDLFGHEAVTVYVVFTDTEPPDFWVEVPETPSEPFNCEPVISSTDVERVEFWLDDSLVATDYTDPYVFYVYTPDLSDGPHNLTIVVYDEVGNYAIQVRIFTVDNTAPDVVIEGLAENDIIAGSVDIVASVTDFSAIQRVEFYIDWELITTDYDAPYIFSLDSTLLTDGEHMFIVKAYDVYSNERILQMQFSVDNSPPELLDVQQNFYNGIPGWQMIVIVSITDDNQISNVNLNLYSNEGYNIQIPMTYVGSGEFQATWYVPVDLIGEFSIDIIAVDELDNTGSFVDISWVKIHDYIGVSSTYSELELSNSIGMVINSTWNDYVDAYGMPLAYYIDDGTAVELLLLSPSSDDYDLAISYAQISAYALDIVAFGNGLIIYEITYAPIAISQGDIHRYLINYNSMTLTADSEALPEILTVVATDTLYVLPGDYVRCQISWFNIDPGTATNVEIKLVYNEYLEFVNCTYPVTRVGDSITLYIGDVAGFSMDNTEIMFYMTNLLAANGTKLWLNATLTYSDDWSIYDFTAHDSQLVTVVTQLPENNLQSSWWWKNEFGFVLSGQSSTYDAEYLLTLVTVVSYSSDVFSDVTTLENALSVLIMDNYKGPSGLAVRELYSVWLNLANDAITADTEIDLAKLTSAGTVGAAILECEAVMFASSVSMPEILNILRICQEINAGRYQNTSRSGQIIPTPFIFILSREATVLVAVQMMERIPPSTSRISFSLPPDSSVI